MARHKYVTRYDPDKYAWFDELKEQGYVKSEYEYTKPGVKAGMIFNAVERGERFVAIASNHARLVKYWGVGGRRRATYRIMYQLTKEGVEYLRELLVETFLEGGDGWKI